MNTETNPKYEQRGEKFPLRLHSFMELASIDPKLSSIVSWLPDGNSFNIHDPVSFAELVLPLHFVGMNSYKSFRRQLNLYGIKKNTTRDAAAGKLHIVYGSTPKVVPNSISSSGTTTTNHSHFISL